MLYIKNLKRFSALTFVKTYYQLIYLCDIIKGNMPRNYKKEAEYESSPEQKKNRAARGRARYAMEKKVGKQALKGKDVDHKKPLIKGGSNATSNLRIKSKSDNRSFPRTKSAGMK